MNYRSWVLTTTAVAVLAAGTSTAALAPERSLAGIVVGSKGVVVLHRYGNPSSVTPGLDERSGFTSTDAAANPAGTSTNPYATAPGGTPPGANSYFPGARSPGSPGSYPGSSYRPGGTPGGYPGASGYQPNAGSLPPAGAEAAGGEAGTADTTGLVTWTYRKFKNGPVVNFRLDEDGKVVEVVANGFKPSPLARTARGVNLGSSYGNVLRLYGFPEESNEQGNVLTIKYTRNAHIAFRFYKLKVVAIAVAQPKRATNAVL